MRRIIAIIIAVIIVLVVVAGVLLAIFHTSVFPATKRSGHTTNTSQGSTSSTNGDGQTSTDASTGQPASTPTTTGDSNTTAAIPSTGPSDPIIIVSTTLGLAAATYAATRMLQARSTRTLL